MLFGAGCGRAAEPASAPVLDASPPPSPPAAAEAEAITDLDALEHDLSVSEERLNLYLASREESRETAVALRDDSESKKAEKPKSSAPSSGAGYAQPPPAAAPRPPRKRAEERPADAAEAAPAPATPAEPEAEPVGSACDLACRAFGSMQRSADRICAIAGESDERCRRARGRVADASSRISGAQCVCQNDE